MPKVLSVSPAISRSRSRSIPERYPDAASYVAAITAAARGLVEDGLMLEEDVERAAAVAASWGRPRHDIRLK
jgi:hypothetical protein